MQSGGPNRERLYRAGGRVGGRADRVRVELNGNPVQSGGLNRERLYGRGSILAGGAEWKGAGPR